MELRRITDGQDISSIGRFLQWKVEMAGTGANTPELDTLYQIYNQLSETVVNP